MVIIKEKFKIIPEKDDILDTAYYLPDKKLCQIPKTTAIPKRDVFAQYKPDPRSKIKYRISQTETKLDDGNTKIHYKETKAYYEHPPVPIVIKKKNKYCSKGAPPCWKFLDEIREKFIEQQQDIARKDLYKRLKQKRKIKFKGQGQHFKVIKMAGPDWYQELSPKQIRTVDNLQSCLEKDLANRTIINTQENIAELGLVLRPNHTKIAKAIKKSKKDPVNFLLELEEMINLAFTSYTINDRLLMSAVVHLTIEDTFKELHKRIPSPPRKEKIKKPPPKPKHIKAICTKVYKSPYLKPLTCFMPKKRKRECKVNLTVCPKSPYFTYVKELKELLSCYVGESTEDVLEEILKELELAKKYYKELFELKKDPRLLLPSIYVSPADRDSETKWVMLEPGTFPEITPVYRTVLIANICDRRQAVKHFKDNMYKYNIGGVISTKWGPQFQISGHIPERPSICDCARIVEAQQEVLKLQAVEHRYLINGVYRNRLGLFFNIAGFVEPHPIISSTPSSYKDTISSISKSTFSDKTSSRTSTKSKPSSRSSSKSKLKALSKTSSFCPCYDYKKGEEADDEEDTEETDDDEDDDEDDKKTKRKTKKQKKSLDTCVCGFTREQKDYIERKAVIKAIKEHGNRMQIGGVVETPLGPIYNVEYFEPPLKCTCQGDDKEMEPLIRICSCEVLLIKYEYQHFNCRSILATYLSATDKKIEEYLKDTKPVIFNNNFVNAGICNTSHGQVYQIRCCIPPPKPCTCMERKKSSSSTTTSSSSSTKSSSSSSSSSTSSSKKEKKTTEEDSSKTEKGKSTPTTITSEEYVCCTCKQEAEVEPCCVCNKQSGDTFSICPCSRQEETFSGIPCTCGPGFVCLCRPDLIKNQIVEEEEEEPFSQFKRFFILKKIPTDRKTQIRLLKNALGSMADDNWPLAKFPDCHELPHFRIWLRYRSGKCWTVKDQRQYMRKSRKLWDHIDRCTTGNFKMPQMPWSKREMKAMTWSKVSSYKEIIFQEKEKYYRNVKQWNINMGREFFPSLFCYEFPTKGFRECFFAYMPSKEEETFPFKIWGASEYKDFTNRRSCL